jgi:hypothetical protein
VAQQSDGSSCGLFAIEFCKVLCAPGADVISESTRAQLLAVETTSTRQWLDRLSRTLDVPMRDPFFVRSSASKRNRTVWAREQAEMAPAVE